MFSWISKDDKHKHEPEVYANVADGLKKLYQQVSMSHSETRYQYAVDLQLINYDLPFISCIIKLNLLVC
jgi:hypothetical protein